MISLSNDRKRFKQYCILDDTIGTCFKKRSNSAKCTRQVTDYTWFFFIVYFGFNESKRVIACRYIHRHGQRVRNCEVRGKRSCYCEWIDGALIILRYYKYRYVLFYAFVYSWPRYANKIICEDIFEFMAIFSFIRSSNIGNKFSSLLRFPWLFKKQAINFAFLKQCYNSIIANDFHKISKTILRENRLTSF